MNIRNLLSGASPASPVRKAESAKDAPQSPSSPTPPSSESAQSAATQDRLELSQAALAQREKDTALDQARKAFFDLPPLEPGRREQILQRVQQGYYSQPEMIDLIAEKLHADATGKDFTKGD